MDPDPYSLTFILAQSGIYTSTGINVLIILLLLLLSAATSGAEVAFFSLTKAEIDDLRSSGNRVDLTITNLLARPRRLLATILIFNNLINVAIILLSTITLHQIVEVIFDGVPSDGWQQYVLPVVEIVVITFGLLFFGEITPKVFASQRKMAFVRSLAIPLKYLRTFFYPFSWTLVKTTSFIDKRINLETEAASHEDIKHAIELTSEAESPEEEKEILKGIVNFSNTAVKSIMRARVDVKAVATGTAFEEVVKMINEYGYSRMPAYEESLDNVKGILYIKDLLPLLGDRQQDKDWERLIRPAYFVPETKKIDDLLEEFKNKRLHIAVVVDEFGGTAGIVTLEDIIEEIFGEINDEFDDEELIYSKLSDYEYVFDGKMPLNDMERLTDIPETAFEEIRGDSDSLAGLILEIHGKIPEVGETISYGNYEFVIEAVSESRIIRVKFVIHPEKETEEES